MHFYLLSLTVLAFFSSTFAAANTPFSDDETPTGYVMEFLKRSGTVWSGSDEWKHQLHEGKTVHTNYMTIRDTTRFEYKGFAVSGHNAYSKVGNVPCDTAKAHFQITVENNAVKVASEIEDTQVTKNLTDEQINVLEKKACMAPSKSENDSDFCSQCTRTYKVNIDKNTRTSRVTVTNKCTSVIPLELFLRQMAKD